MAHITENELEIDLPHVGKPYKVYYKTFGDIKASRPLVAVHGGPGVDFGYMESFEDLYTKYNIPVLIHQQAGNGKSTRFPDKMGDTSFWTEQFLIDELIQVLDKLNITDYDYLGHSYGGMMGLTFAASGHEKVKGMRRFIVSNTSASIPLWQEAARMLLKRFPQELQDTIQKHEDAGTTDSEEYEAAAGQFYAQHLVRLDPMPDKVAETFKSIKDEPACYATTVGPSEFTITGSIKDWSAIPYAHKIDKPTLLINGEHDIAQDFTVKPLFNTIPKVKWVRVDNASHLTHWEQREKYMEIVADFLQPS